MDPQLDQRLTAIEKKLDDMNAVISRMHRSARNARNRRILYWIIIIALTLFSFYSIKPYLEQLKDAYGSIEGMGQYSDLLKDIK